jgi:hypothetical protein
MSKVAWSSAVVFLVAALGTTSSGCTVTITGDDGGGVGPTGDDEDAAQPDASGDDAGQTPDGSTCSVGVTTGSTACDDCIESSCCDAVVTCDSEPTSGGAMTDCEEIDSCYGDCLSPPAGSGVAPDSATECAMLCATGHTPNGNTDFTALQSCTSANCASQCQ